ncbi:DUF6111 family protein [Acuticoccus mangrovi]|uniref:Uncharacterized protein n=1 Tax=Acuticoccus mangrovi TaxID=2796142 RepID=A0A934IP37_9HYPH|nr:DUF6111 family protein [Acuticoccus mangrovi]MBJ3775958.1 hypothetical protein [Acuticoccus mangrovi]
MIRIIITQLVLFALPFVAFFVYRLTTHGWTGARVATMGRAAFALTVIGGLLVIGGFVYFAMTSGTSEGVYVPAQYRDGKLIPGGFRPR